MGSAGSSQAEKVYQNFDLDKNKKLDLHEIKTILECHCVEAEQKVLPREYDLLYYLLDSDGNGSISKKEFQRLYDGMQKTEFRQDIYQLIAYLADANNDNSISKKELKIVYKFYGKKMTPEEEKLYSKDITKEQLIELIKEKLMK